VTPPRLAAVLFDLDGTLLDSLKDLAESMNAVLKSLGLPSHPLSAYRTFVGDGMEKLVERSLPAVARRDGSLFREALARLKNEYLRRWRRNTRPYPGIPELLDRLTNHRIPKAILTNKPEPFTLEIVSTVLNRWEFDIVRGARENTPKKPDPTAAL